MTLTDQLERLRPLPIFIVGALAGYSPKSIYTLRDRGDKPLSKQRLYELGYQLSQLSNAAYAMGDEARMADEQ